jgi:hypothetical protein
MRLGQAAERTLRRSFVARCWITLGLAATLGLGLSAAALAAGASIHVDPHRVEVGHRIHVRGSVDGGCPVGAQVTLYSKAFPHRHDFAGVPAVHTRVKSGHKFRRHVRIPDHRRARRYSVHARCGGGNLGVAAHFRVVH